MKALLVVVFLSVTLASKVLAGIQWPSQFHAVVRKEISHTGELWTGRWSFDKNLQKEVIEMSSRGLTILEFNFYDQGKRYVLESEETAANTHPRCTSSAIQNDISTVLPQFSDYKYIGKRTLDRIQLDAWQRTDNISVHTLYFTGDSIPAAFEVSNFQGHSEITKFSEWKNGPQLPRNYEVEVELISGCRNSDVPFVHTIFGSPAVPLLSCAQMKSLAHQYFPAKYDTDMICISYFESSWNPNAYNGICCYGLWQINRDHLGEPGCPGSVNELYNADTNAKCARHVLDTQGLNAWTTWTSGDCKGWTKCVA